MHLGVKLIIPFVNIYVWLGSHTFASMHTTATCKSLRFDIVYVVRGRSATPKVWRRWDEHGLLALAGDDKYAKQELASRMIPLWGGVDQEALCSFFGTPSERPKISNGLQL